MLFGILVENLLCIRKVADFDLGKVNTFKVSFHLTPLMPKSTHFLHHFIGTERIQQFIILSVDSVYVLIVELAVGTDVFLWKGGLNVFVFLM